MSEPLDLLIVGAGLAGLAAACAAQDAGLSYIVVERCGPVQSLVEHPEQIRYFSPADEMAIGGVPFPVPGGHKPTREDALSYYRAVIAARGLRLATWEEVEAVERAADPQGAFSVLSRRRVAGDGQTVVRHARFLLICTGTFPNPRRLRVPGADLPKVLTRLADPTPYFGRDVLVVGGGNSAATAAMTLAEAGARVTLAMRRPPADFQSHLRPFIVRDLTIMAEEGRLTLMTGVCVTAIGSTSVHLVQVVYGTEPDAAPGDAPMLEIPNDFVFALLGHTADKKLLSRLGVPLDAEGRPLYDEETAETPVPRLYVAGSLSRANIILESRRRAVEIVTRIAQGLGKIPPGFVTGAGR